MQSIAGDSSWWPGDRQQLATVVSTAVSTHHADQTALANARSLVDPEVFIIACGQQPALGGGPLYTLLKAAHAIALCRQLQQQGQRAVPLFWCASDDHDAGEGDHADVVGRDGRLLRIRGTIEQRGAALRHQRATAHWPALIAGLEQLAGPRLGQAFLHHLQPSPDEGMGGWLCRLLHALFAGSGLCCVEAWQLRPLFQSAIERSVHDWPRDSLAKLRQHLLASGHSEAFPPLDQPPWFVDTPQQRRALDPAEVLALAATDPLSLSPGAALRPILQQWALPVAAYCAGPGEEAYHAFLAPAYPALGLRAPLLIPRFSATLVDSWCQRGLEAWGIEARALRPGMALPQIEDLDYGRAGISQLKEAGDNLRILAATAEADLRQRYQSALRGIEREEQRLRRSIERGLRQRSQRCPAGVLRAWLYPRNQPQERVMSLSQAVWHYGPGIANTCIEAAVTSPCGRAHHVMRID